MWLSKITSNNKLTIYYSFCTDLTSIIDELFIVFVPNIKAQWACDKKRKTIVLTNNMCFILLQKAFCVFTVVHDCRRTLVLDTYLWYIIIWVEYWMYGQFKKNIKCFQH